ncbi:MAG: hypothetical protein HFG26_06170 [Provencibacterium sp.]|nr:hypothetical protein [Provencibacterium sp.]
MEEARRRELLRRNRRIIEAVRAKAARVCPGAVDLIAVTGSFCSGDFYEKSDLDLLIVINSSAGWRIAKCFILGDVAHDLYCHTWEQLERMAEYPDPHAGKLLDADIVYQAGEEARGRYDRLRGKLSELLRRPFGREDLEKIRPHYEAALQAFARLCLEEDPPHSRYQAAWLLWAVEYIVYMCNKSYIRHGVRGIPKEICALEKLPRGFRENYFALIEADGLPAVRSSAKALLASVRSFLREIERGLPEKPLADADALRGSYEEIYSNWRNKMRRAAGTGDRYLALVTAASCQAFYDEMFERYAIGRYDLFEGAPSRSLEEAAQAFERVMEDYRELYTGAALPVCRYESVEAFESDYLK